MTYKEYKEAALAESPELLKEYEALTSQNNNRVITASQEERSEGLIGYTALQVADEMDAIIQGVEDGKDDYAKQFDSAHGNYTKERHERLDKISLDEICGQIEAGRK